MSADDRATTQGMTGRSPVVVLSSLAVMLLAGCSQLPHGAESTWVIRSSVRVMGSILLAAVMGSMLLTGLVAGAKRANWRAVLVMLGLGLLGGAWLLHGCTDTIRITPQRITRTSFPGIGNWNLDYTDVRLVSPESPWQPRGRKHVWVVHHRDGRVSEFDLGTLWDIDENALRQKLADYGVEFR